MSTKIYANARFGLREDTLENWFANNPVLEKGEPAVVRDGENGEWLKIGDGVTAFSDLPWKKGPKGDKGEQGVQGEKGETGANGKDAVTDQAYSPESQNAQSGIAVAEAITLFDESKQKNFELIATITVTPDENGDLPISIIFTEDSDGNSFELTDFYVRLYGGFTDGTTSRFYMAVNDICIMANASIDFRSDSMRSTNVIYRQGIDGFVECTAMVSSAGAGLWSSQVGVSKQILIPPIVDDMHHLVNKISLYTLQGANRTWLDGSEFRLYGVRK